MEKVFELEKELNSILPEVEKLKNENFDLKNWKEEASDLLILQKETIIEFQRKYRKCLLFADALQKKLKNLN